MNKGISYSKGDIICFIDDDAIADKLWIQNLFNSYWTNPNIYGVGGKIIPIWLSNKPNYLPEEFEWMIGSTAFIYPPYKSKTRNFWSSNASFRASVFNEVGLFNSKLGRSGKKLSQGEDAEFCIRCNIKYEDGLIYDPSVIVYHKVYPHRLLLVNLFNRAFQQGVSKAILRSSFKNYNSLSSENHYLRLLLNKSLPKYFKRLLCGSSKLGTIQKLSFIFVSLFLIFMGFLEGMNPIHVYNEK